MYFHRLSGLLTAEMSDFSVKKVKQYTITEQ
jgi:hypothetical protein